jgi:hypothetical protein
MQTFAPVGVSFAYWLQSMEGFRVIHEIAVTIVQRRRSVEESAESRRSGTVAIRKR